MPDCDESKPRVFMRQSTRTVWISGEIDIDMSEARLAIHDVAHAEGNQGETITLVINSMGGSLDGVFALMDEMDRLRFDRGVRFEGVAEGAAYSAALILLQHCEHRCMGRRATLMAHGFTFGQTGDIKDQEILLAITKAQTREVATLFARRTEPLGGRDYHDWYDDLHSSRDLYYRAPEALREGLVDEVIG